MKPIQERKGLNIVLFNLLIVAISGLILRAFHYTSVPILNYSNFMEGHSHFAFGGWGFMILFIAFYHIFLDKKKIKRKSYAWIFWIALITTWGMLFTFPIHGYADISTTFATLYIWTTYWFAYRFYKDTQPHQSTISLKFARAALFFLVFSSIGPYAMGVLMALGYRYDPRAMDAIYFYLHFQYNGWFIFAILSLFFKWLENKKIDYSFKKAHLFYRLLFWACFPAVLLSFLWSNPNIIIFIIAGIAGIVQLVALIPFLRIIKNCKRVIHKNAIPIFRKIGGGVLVLLALKYIIQGLDAVPAIAAWTATTRNLIIAYLHLVLLGVFSIFMLVYFIQIKLISLNILSKIGLWLFIVGFVLTEVFLFCHAGLSLFHIYIPDFGIWMFYTTIPLPLGVLLLFVNQLRKSDKIALL